MEVNKNSAECFLCWKKLNTSKTITSTFTYNEEVQTNFHFSKQQTDNCKKYLKTEIIRFDNQNCDMNGWECQKFCSSCFENSESLTALDDVLEETQKELNLVVELFNKQIFNERRKKLNSSFSSVTDDFSDGFGEDDLLNSDKESEVCLTLSSPLESNNSNGTKKNNFQLNNIEESADLFSRISKKRKLEPNKNKSPGKSTKKSTTRVPRLILEKLSDGVAKIMQAKLLERLVRDGIISQPPHINKKENPISRIFENKSVLCEKIRNDSREENDLLVVKPSSNDASNCNDLDLEIKHEEFSSSDFYEELSPSDHSLDTEMVETAEVENSENSNVYNLGSCKDLRINLSRFDSDWKNKKSAVTAADAPPVNKNVTGIKSKLKENSANNTQQQLILKADIEEETVNEDNKMAMENTVTSLNYKCDTCGFKAASFEELFDHKKTHGMISLKCTVCQKEFSKERSFFTHMRYHTVTSSIVLAHVTKATKVTRKRNKLTKHKKPKHVYVPDEENISKDTYYKVECKITGKLYSRNAHKDRRKYYVETCLSKCEDCKMRFSTAEKVAFHQRKHDESTSKAPAAFFECHICGNIYTRDSGLHRHLRYHSGIKPFKCEVCDKRFARGSFLTIHHKKHISNFDFICERENCGEKFKIVQELNQHKRFHMKQDFLTENDKKNHYECPECKTKFKKHHAQQFVFHMLSHELRFTCSICEKKFTTKIALDEHHEQEHDGRYPCTLCSLTFKYKNGLSHHMQINHIQTDRHICEDCGASFKGFKNFKDHQLEKHPTEDQKTFKCDKCERVFLSRSKFMTHRLLAHNNHQCEICGVNVKNLKQHLMRTHNEIPAECDICGKKFKGKELLSRHKRVIHEGQTKECKICNRKFNSNNTLTLHMRVHTGEKPYQCSECPKRFDRKQNLNSHMRLHTGEKPYKCEKCAKQFSRSDNLNTHVKKCTL